MQIPRTRPLARQLLLSKVVEATKKYLDTLHEQLEQHDVFESVASLLPRQNNFALAQQHVLKGNIIQLMQIFLQRANMQDQYAPGKHMFSLLHPTR
jgi:hypothetical protein